MDDRRERRILAETEAVDLVGRSTELNTLSDLARGDSSIVLAGPPGSGVSELLKQTYDRLFHKQNKIIPFYFALSFSGVSPVEEARRFLHQFLMQTVAFRRRDPAILNWFPELGELSELALPTDKPWVDRLLNGIRDPGRMSEEPNLLRVYLAAPLRAATAGAPSFVMVDDCHMAVYSKTAEDLFRLLRDTLENNGVPCVFAGRRRFDFGTSASRRIGIDRLGPTQASRVVEQQSDRFGVRITDETRDLVAIQFAGNCSYITQIFQTSAEQGAELDSFLNVQKLYTHEIFGGRIRRHLDGMIDRIVSDHDVRFGLLSFLNEGPQSGPRQFALESWLKGTALDRSALDRMAERLNIEELVRVNGQRIEPGTADRVMRDYASVRVRLEVTGEPRAVVFGQSLGAYLKRSPRLMAEWYRHRAAIGLRELLARFALQQVPLAALDYGVFAAHYKGLPDDEIMTGLRADEACVGLPQIVFTANADDLYEPIGELTESDRSTIALGFQKGQYSDDDEIVWIVAEIDSKLEGTADVAEFWCDRLEKVAVMGNFANFQLWLIAPEGFTPEAIDVLRRRSAFGSSRRQAGFLKAFVTIDSPETLETADEYEVVVPMDDESELIAAYALEEIARRHNITAKAINQIKTALIEASINASEHSLSPDRRIRQKFRVEEDRIIVTISNRGLRLSDRNRSAEDATGGASVRRGWGLKLIEKLMDEVKVHQTDDGTSISMTKYLNTEAAA